MRLLDAYPVIVTPRSGSIQVSVGGSTTPIDITAGTTGPPGPPGPPGPEGGTPVVAVPYDEETRVPYRGRWVVETIAPGAFDGVERRANRVKVNLAHEVEAVLGRAVALRPSDPRGLVAELRISKTPKGDDVLELAADGALDASIGFAPMPGGEQWLDGGRTRRRITRAYL